MSDTSSNSSIPASPATPQNPTSIAPAGACPECGITVPSCHPYGLVLCPCGLQNLVVAFAIVSSQRPLKILTIPEGSPPEPDPIRERKQRVRSVNPSNELSDERVAWCRGHATQGANQADLARVLGVPKYVIQRLCRGHCPPGRKPEGAPTLAELREDFRTRVRGMTRQDEIRIAVAAESPGASPQWSQHLQDKLVLALRRDVTAYSGATKVARVAIVMQANGAPVLPSAFIGRMIRHEIHSMRDAGYDATGIAAHLHLELTDVEAAMTAEPAGFVDA